MMSAVQHIQATVRPILTALLLIAAVEAAAQTPPHLQGFSSALVTTLDRQRDLDLLSFDTLGGGRRRADGFRMPEQREIWTQYGGLGFMGFQNKLDGDNDGARFKLG